MNSPRYEQVRKAEKERKQAILDQMVEDRGVDRPEHVPHLQLLLEAYASGEDRRQEIADNIVAKFRPYLRNRNTGTNYDGPLYAEIEQALRAAEEYGRCEAQLTAAERKEQETMSRTDKAEERATGAANVFSSRFSTDEVQQCLFCSAWYRPAVERHACLNGQLNE